MPDEKKIDEKAAKTESSPLIRRILLLSMFILIPVVLAVATVYFVLNPMMAPPADSTDEEVVDVIPPTAMTVEFDEVQATVRTEGPDEAAPVLVYKIAMAVSDPATAAVIEAKKAWFSSMLGKLHRNRTRSELNDPYVEETILKQAKQEANLLLKKLDPGVKHEVLEVMHLKYAIFDM